MPAGSRSEVLCKKVVLKNVAKLTWKELRQSFFFNKVTDLTLWHRCFPVNFANLFKKTFFTEHLRTTASEQLQYLQSLS